jgi:hypothetical protein
MNFSDNIFTICMHGPNLKLQWNSVITNFVNNEHSVITNVYKSQIGYFSTHINPVITNKNEQSQTVRLTEFHCNSIECQNILQTVFDL